LLVESVAAGVIEVVALTVAKQRRRFELLAADPPVVPMLPADEAVGDAQAVESPDGPAQAKKAATSSFACARTPVAALL
jgi:hypothetical protein